MRRSSLRSTAAADAGAPLVLDYSGSTRSVSVTFGSDTDGTLRVSTSETSTAYTGVSSVTATGTIFTDSFNVSKGAVATGRSIVLDGGDGIDTLAVDLSGAAAAIKVLPASVTKIGAVQFSHFEAYTLTLGDFANSIRTAGGNDTISGTRGTNTISTLGGNDTITITGATNSFIDAGGGDDTIKAQGAGTIVDGGLGTDSWSGTTPEHKTGSVALSYDSSDFHLPDGTIVRNVEKVSIINTRGDSTFDLTGDFAAKPLDLYYYAGGSSGTPTTCVVTADGSMLGQGLTVGMEGVGERGAPLTLTLRSGDFTGRFDRVDLANVIGTAFDDAFSVNDNYARASINFDGGAGFDTLRADVYDPFWDDLSYATLIVHTDGTIETSLGKLANIEQFYITGAVGTFVTGDYDDTISAAGTLSGGGGDDKLYSYGGRSILDGGAGNDELVGLGADIASYASATAGVRVNLGLSTQDTGGAGIDTLSGFASLIGSAFNDTLTGNGIDNTIEGGAGDDVLDALGGVDTASYASATRGVNVSLAIAGPQDTVGSGTDTLLNFENLIGSAFDDVLSGDAGTNRLDGGAGLDRASYLAATSAVAIDLRLTGAQDTGFGTDTLVSIEGLIGSAFNDTLTGNAGNNDIDGGLGDDLMDGTTGFDIARYVTATSGVTVSLAVSGPQDTGGAGRDTLYNFEGLAGSSFDDVLTGNSGDNLLIGGDGNDRLIGGAGSDELRGGAGEADTAVYAGGDLSSYTITKVPGGYTVATNGQSAVDTLSGIEYVEIGGSRYAIEDVVNVAPVAVADRVRGLVAGQSGAEDASGNVLANDRDANLANPALGETIEVVGVSAGRHEAEPLQGAIQGKFGTLTLQADGSYAYHVDDTLRATERLTPGATGRDLFTYEIADAHGQTSSTTLVFAVEKGSASASAVHDAVLAWDAHASVLAIPNDLPLG